MIHMRHDLDVTSLSLCNRYFYDKLINSVKKQCNFYYFACLFYNCMRCLRYGVSDALTGSLTCCGRCMCLKETSRRGTLIIWRVKKPQNLPPPHQQKNNYQTKTKMWQMTPWFKTPSVTCCVGCTTSWGQMHHQIIHLSFRNTSAVFWKYKNA